MKLKEGRRMKTMASTDSKVKIEEQYRRCFKNTLIGTKLSQQEIINQIHTMFGTNESNIIPRDYCYNMTNTEKPDNSPKFFLNVENDVYEYVGENYSGVNISDVISAYKADFDRIDKDEIFKWQAIKWYKEHWNIDATDFATMFISAFSKTDNLLASNMYYPYKMICHFTQMHPEEVRNMFKNLYDEEKPLSERYSNFRSKCEEYLTEYRNSSEERANANNHYQDLHAISVYLSFEYPETYFIYKFKVYKNFRKLIGFTEEKSRKKSEVWKLENYNRMCQSVLAVVNTDSNLLKLNSSRLGSDCYQDEAYHLLTMDIVYFGATRMSTKNKPVAKTAYWPTLQEYDPHITVKQWKDILADKTITTNENLAMFKMMLELGGESTCAHLADIYGNAHSYYNMIGSSFGKRVQKKLKCPEYYYHEKISYYPIPFVGRYVTENDKKRYSWKLRNELKKALESMDLTDIKLTDNKKVTTDIPKNIILYGPPGTGKTYYTVIYAVAIIENKPLSNIESEPYEEVVRRYNDYKSAGLIEFTTFHQSYGYEEFIEGIKPVMNTLNDEQKDISYEISSGLFKNFCEKASQPASKKINKCIEINASPTIWKVSLEGTGNNATRAECLANGHIRIGYDGYGKNITNKTNFSTNGGKKVLDAFINKMQVGDIVLSCFSSTTIDAIGIITGNYEWHDEYEHYKRLRKVNWLVKNIREDIAEANGSKMTLSSVYKLKISLSDVMSIIRKYDPEEDKVQENTKNHVFIIDEINRGNISKIFGELITLIEPTKRIGQIEAVSVKLPYSKKLFGVPDNIYIIGTMNTADRSIATIDTALRRRFQFKEMQPNPNVLDGVYVEDISIKELFDRMNLKISILYDREHTIGHAYFTKLKENPTIEMLASIFKNTIIPLLQEYFYEDYEKIRLILGDNNKQNEEEQFITAKITDCTALFGNTDFGIDDTFRNEINTAAFNNIEAYRYI